MLCSNTELMPTCGHISERRDRAEDVEDPFFRQVLVESCRVPYTPSGPFPEGQTCWTGINYTPLEKVGVTMKMMPEGAFKHPKAGRPEGREEKLQTVSHRKHPTQRHRLVCREFKNF